MTNDPVWRRLEACVRQIYSLPHNVVALRSRIPPETVDEAVEKTLGAVRSGLMGAPVEEHFVGPKLFLRAAGAGNRVYAGEWWFDADLHQRLDKAYSRIYFASRDRAAVIRDMLRELLAVSREWNPMTEIWALELTQGEPLVGFSGIGSPQPLYAGRPNSGPGSRMLIGGAKQIFFPVKNPFSVHKYRDLGRA